MTPYSGSRELDWDTLLHRIRQGRCTPFLGAGACKGVLPLGGELARDWAREFDYPLEDCTDLARVAQYLAVTRDEMRPKELIAERLGKLGPPDFQAPDEPHGVLANLPLPVYLTTNYDDFLVQALRSRHRSPKRELCRWNSKTRKKVPSIFEQQPGFEPDPANPVVFHLHGHLGLPESLVLTEDDYLDFLVNIAKDEWLLPPRIQESLTGASLLFLGYRIADWDFRVLFQSLVLYLEKSVRRAHVSVQLVPAGENATEEQKGRIQHFLDKYFDDLKIQVYWGTCQEFVAELRRRWEGSSGGR